MKATSFLLLSMIAFLFSCKENDPTEMEPAPLVTSEYMPLQIGNYWIYQWFNTDMNGNENLDEIIDSVYISKDTMIQNRKYYKLERSQPYYDVVIPRFISDSSGYLLSWPGFIILSPDPTETFIQNGSTSKHTSYTCRKDSSVTTPARIFNHTITYQTLREENNGVSGYYHRVFAKNVGMIERDIYHQGDPARPFGVKLIRYRVN